MTGTTELTRRRGNLVAAPSSFIGRDGDLERLADRFERGARVVTLVGPPGVGKTRLALAHCEIEAKTLEAVWFCDLTAARSGWDVIATVADVSRVPLAPGGTEADATRQVGYALASHGRSLLLLDNVEQVVAATSDLVRAWIEIAPDLRLIATSREPLAIAIEVLHDVEPLDAATGAALFTERALALRPSFSATGAEEQAVIEIVRRLDGLPLAIELAAARVSVLEPSGLLARLSQRLDLLRSSDRDRPLRRSSLRAALDSSWEMLDAHERDALSRLTAFIGGFTAASAIAVIDAADPAASIDLLDRLRRRSLVFELPSTPKPRLSLLESVREYVLDVARGQDVLDSAADLHARHFAELIENASVAEARAELDNVIAAHAFAVPRAPELAARIALGIERIAAGRRPVAARWSMLDRSLGSLRSDAPALLRARLLCARADVARAAARTAEAREDARAAIDLATGDLGRTAASKAHLVLAQLFAYDQRWEDASEEAAKALAIGDAAGGGRESIEPRRLLGSIAAMRLRVDDARTHLHAALLAAIAAGDRHEEALALSGLGELEQGLGQLARSRTLREQALALHRAAGDRAAEGVTLLNLAYLALEAGDWARAESLAREARSTHSELGHRRLEAIALVCLGSALGRQRRLQEAMECARAALAAAGGTGQYVVALATMGVAVVEALLGALGVARAAFDSVRALLESAPSPLLVAVLEVLEGFYDLAGAREARDNGQPERPFVERARARARPPAAASFPEPSDVRVVRRLLDDELERWNDVENAAEEPRSDALRIERSGRWFELKGARVPLAHRPVLRRLLLGLVNARIDRPGAPVTTPMLLAAGWPEERISRDAAARRLYVMIARLRDAGLRDILLADPDGYLLDPRVPAEVVDGD